MNRQNMSKAPTRVLEQGRVTIPADLRRDLELETGDYVVIDVEPLGDE
jgi:AbrB family looped-hinge helix DNA binding protein